MILIEVFHSRFGSVSLEVRSMSYDGGFHTIQFFYPDGVFMGEWSPDLGGGLNFPTIETRNSMECFVFIEEDERSYLELENLLFKSLLPRLPNFFDPDTIEVMTR